ncbi:hypothetical protein [Roseicella aerolata]|uniref:Nuclease n=1 Tax=Roseicella aerolata TaxID=2883479 RepID=A0A9X1IGS1_9PROT|nr:hypothetical protein [Roseicella aerolata]MCB4823874.1 hypothetical protein [Roseicella aerolata]
MPFTLIKGSFHVVGYAPDGDSIRFGPDDPTLLDDLIGPAAELNSQLHVQLRIEGIDALETHYRPQGGRGNLHQPKAQAIAARTALLEFLGIGGVVWNADETRVVAAQDGVRGCILTRAVEKNRRPVAFAYAGDPAGQDGAAVHLDVPRLKGSWNYHAVARGLAYPTFYTGLFEDLRAAMIEATEQARMGGTGLFAEDTTTEWFLADSIAAITEDAVIMPKLFRRLATHLSRTGGLAGFKAALQASRERLLDLRRSNFTHFDSFVEEHPDGRRIRMTRRPEELVFDEMRQRTGNIF